MNQTIRRFICVLTLGVLLMGACQSESTTVIPITGSSNKSTLPARVTLAQQNVLEHVLVSRLQNLPPHADWQLHEVQNQKEYHFRSGDWLMVIWALGDGDQRQPVVILNQVEQLSWTGYVAPDGRVVATDLGR